MSDPDIINVTLKIKNINMTGGESISSYILGKSFSNDEIVRIREFSEITLKKNNEFIENLTFFKGDTTLLLGFPIGNASIIPYAIFDLTVSA